MLYLVLATKSFRRMLAYRAATLAGLLTNLFFGLLRAYVFIALFAAAGRQRVAGFSVGEAITFTALGQALIGPLRIWGSTEVLDRIRTGDIAVDLARPVGLFGAYLAQDLGRAVFEALGRGLPLLAAYSLVFDLSWPAGPLGWLAFLVAALLGVTISFGWRFLVNLGAFWLVDARGLARLASLGVLIFSGLILPLAMFPPALVDLARALPFAGFIDAPARVWLGQVQGRDLAALLVRQAAWALALALAGQAVYRRGIRRLVIQGG
jgi:ABC-2 type transport system permease protein